MDNYILVEPGGDITSIMMSDLEHMENIKILYKSCVINNPLLKKIWLKHIGYRLNKKHIMPLQSIWWKFYTLNDIKYNDSDQYYIIFGNAVLNTLDDRFIRKLNSKKNIHLILYFSDPVDSYFARLAKLRVNRNYFSYIFTFDSADAKKYGYILMRNLYSVSNVKPDMSTKSDICFIGENKGRLEKLQQICDECKKNHVHYNFRMTRVRNSDERQDGIIYNRRIPYLETIAQAKASNCLLEILQEGQTGVTFRYYEAVCYNKKLLTNNPDVINLPYYDPRYMRYYKNITDIDFEWIKKYENIDYHYNGEFSPIKFLGKIKKLVNDQNN